MSSVAHVLSVAPVGFNGNIIEVETDNSKGLPSLQIVGMGSKAIDEARDRVRSAIKNSLLDFPARKITVNLAPAELPKDGSHYDLAIAVSILISSGQLRQEEAGNALFVGELALDGSLRPVKGIISSVECAKKRGIDTVYLPTSNLTQAGLIPDITLIGITSLKQLFLHLKREAIITPYERVLQQKQPNTSSDRTLLDDIYGQTTAKRALVVAAAGHHNILLTGSPGAGKTMMAKVVRDLLPALSTEEQIAVTKLHSLGDGSHDTIVESRPFRSPHHTASRVALIGGGPKAKPGEISLAHLGVLFLDEIPEYPRASLESLRQPLEDKTITVSRANHYAQFPADFMLVATMNPCPCGYYGDANRECSCSSVQILAYQKRLSGPLLDRIDLTVDVKRVPHTDLLKKSKEKLQHTQAVSVIGKARKLQNNRYSSSHKNNGNISSREVKQYIPLSSEVQQLLDKAADSLHLTARSYFKVIKVARTIADLDESEAISTQHLAEALQYRINPS